MVEKSRTIANSAKNSDPLIIEYFARWKAKVVTENSIMEEGVFSLLITKNSFFGFCNKQFETLQPANMILLQIRPISTKTKKCFGQLNLHSKPLMHPSLGICNSKSGLFVSCSHEFF
jgi:hypothetical protein